MKCLLLFTLLSIVITSSQLYAQQGYSSASLSMNRANGILSPDQVIVEEYLNYHTHKIPLPYRQEEIALSVDYLNLNENQVAIQVGISSKQLIDYSAVPPINVCLVIDRSGSMDSDNKLEKVKRALLKFTKGLRPEDYLAIVAYDSEASVVLESTKLGKIANIEGVIKSLQTAGSTNLHGGLMLGYKQIQKHFNAKYTNKVILLTDGIANVGITDTEKIVKESGSYNQEGIDVATIGVGNNLNYSLLQKISKKGRGDNHFVGNKEEDIRKVFEDELESLLAQIGKKASLTLTLPDGLTLTTLFGYNPTFSGNELTIPLNNINNGLTQVIVLDCKVKKGAKKIPFKATLNYWSCAAESNKSMEAEANIKTNLQQMGPTEVSKSYYIGKMAQSLKDMAEKVAANEPSAAVTILTQSLSEIEHTFPHLRDKDLIRVRDILVKEKEKLDQFIVTKGH